MCNLFYNIFCNTQIHFFIRRLEIEIFVTIITFFLIYYTFVNKMTYFQNLKFLIY